MLLKYQRLRNADENRLLIFEGLSIGCFLSYWLKSDTIFLPNHYAGDNHSRWNFLQPFNKFNKNQTNPAFISTGTWIALSIRG